MLQPDSLATVSATRRDRFLQEAAQDRLAGQLPPTRRSLRPALERRLRALNALLAALSIGPLARSVVSELKGTPPF